MTMTLKELETYAVNIDQRMFTYENMKNSYNSLIERTNKVLSENQDLKYKLNSIEDIEKRFYAIEKFTKYLLDYFDPATKALKKIERLEIALAEKDKELKELKFRLNGLLK